MIIGLRNSEAQWCRAASRMAAPRCLSKVIPLFRSLSLSSVFFCAAFILSKWNRLKKTDGQVTGSSIPEASLSQKKSWETVIAQSEPRTARSQSQ